MKDGSGYLECNYLMRVISFSGMGNNQQNSDGTIQELFPNVGSRGGKNRDRYTLKYDRSFIQLKMISITET